MDYESFKNLVEDIITGDDNIIFKFAFCLLFPGVIIFAILYRSIFLSLSIGKILIVSLIINTAVYIIFNLIEYKTIYIKVLEKIEQRLEEHKKLKEQEQSENEFNRINFESMNFINETQSIFKNKGINRYFEFALTLTTLFMGALLYFYFSYIIEQDTLKEHIIIAVMLLVGYLIFYFKNRIKL